MQCQDKSSGGFVRLFPELESAEFDIRLLEKLAVAMQSQSIQGHALLAGYTYWGQFIAHDVTHLKGSESTSHGVERTVDSLQQLVSPALDLSSVYGDGFFDSSLRVDFSTGKFVLGFSQDSNQSLHYGRDLPRDQNKQVLIADPRNDDNLILAQFHLQIMKLHNLMVDEYSSKDPSNSPVSVFEKVRKDLTYYYHEAVLFDFLFQILDRETWQEIIVKDKNYIWKPKKSTSLAMPIEFSAAAFRFGHTMIQRSYKLKRGNVKLRKIMRLTSRHCLLGNDFLPDDMVIDWDNFFDLSEGDKHRNEARSISPTAILELKIPGNSPASGPIALKNLLRGIECGLPSGQNVFRLFKKGYPDMPDSIRPNTLTARQLNPKIGEKRLLSKWLERKISEETPLWYYLMAESTSTRSLSSRGLGKLGSLIVAETLKNLIQGTAKSLLSGSRPNYRCITRTGDLTQISREHPPFVGRRVKRHALIADLLNAAK